MLLLSDNRFRADGASAVAMSSLREMTTAHRLYERLGFVRTPDRDWYISADVDLRWGIPDEETADCFAVQRGRRQGWLSAEGLDEICKFIKPAKGDSMHFSGSHRCDQMRKCYADPSIK